MTLDNTVDRLSELIKGRSESFKERILTNRMDMAKNELLNVLDSSPKDSKSKIERLGQIDDLIFYLQDKKTSNYVTKKANSADITSRMDSLLDNLTKYKTIMYGQDFGVESKEISQLESYLNPGRMTKKANPANHTYLSRLTHMNEILDNFDPRSVADITALKKMRYDIDHNRYLNKIAEKKEDIRELKSEIEKKLDSMTYERTKEIIEPSVVAEYKTDNPPEPNKRSFGSYARAGVALAGIIGLTLIPSMLKKDHSPIQIVKHDRPAIHYQADMSDELEVGTPIQEVVKKAKAIVTPTVAKAAILNTQKGLGRKDLKKLYYQM